MKKDNNQSDKIVIALLILLIVILSSFLCYLCIKIVQRDLQTARSNNTIQMFKYKKPTKIEKDTSLKESEVKKIYNNSISSSNINVHNLGTGNYTDYYEKIYLDGNVDLAIGLTFDQKVEMALRKMDSSKFTEEINAWGSGTRSFSSFDLQESYENIFGKDTYIANNFTNNYGSCTLTDLTYNCNVSSIWSNIGNMKLIDIYDSYKQKDKLLYIYEYVAYYNTYSTYFTLDRYGYNPIYDFGSYYLTETNEELTKLSYKNYFKKYTHTFSLDEDNNYVWISTEPYIEPTDTVNETYEQTS